MSYPLGLYNGLPPHSNKTTSLKAAVETDSETFRGQVLQSLLIAGRNGATSDQLQRLLNRPMSSITARVRELVLLGLVVKTKRVMKTRYKRDAHIYVVAAFEPPDAFESQNAPQPNSSYDISEAADAACKLIREGHSFSINIFLSEDLTTRPTAKNICIRIRADNPDISARPGLTIISDRTAILLQPANADAWFEKFQPEAEQRL